MTGVVKSNEIPTYRLARTDAQADLERLRSPAGLFVPTTNALPVGARCVVEVVAVDPPCATLVEAVVVARRLPGGAGASLAPGVTLKAKDAPPIARTITATPCSAASDLVAVVEALLHGEPVAFDLPQAVAAGDRARLTTGVPKWPHAVSFEALVGSCVPQQTCFRCVVTLVDEAARDDLQTFAARMRQALRAAETSEVFRAWRPSAAAR